VHGCVEISSVLVLLSGMVLFLSREKGHENILIEICYLRSEKNRRAESTISNRKTKAAVRKTDAFHNNAVHNIVYGI
jgi:hypothetical protein